MNDKTEYKVYRVEWLAFTQNTSWVLKEDLEEDVLQSDLRIVTIGFLVYENADVMVLSCSNASESVSRPLIIPKVAITSIKEISVQ